MPSLAAGLAAGLQGFQRGRQQRDERFAQEDAVAYKRQQDQLEQERFGRQEEMQRAQMQAQAQAMADARARLQAQDARQMQLDRRDAADRGEAPVDEVRAEGENLAGSYGGGQMGDAMVKTLGVGLQGKAQRPTYQIGDVGFVKRGPSLAEQSAARIAAERSGEREQDYTRNLERDKANDARDMERDRANRASAERVAGMQIAGRAPQQDARADARADALANKLRAQYEAHPAVKQANLIAGMMQNVESTAKNPNAAGDLSMIFSYMKILDPNSVVRETEFANAQNAAGVPDRVRNAYNKAMTGQRLTPEQRSEFVGQARGIGANARILLKQQNERYAQISAQMGVDPALVIFDPYATLDQPTDAPKTRTVPMAPPTPARKYSPRNPYAGGPP